MADIKYLWINRARFSFNNLLMYRAWAKRIVSLPELIRRNLNRSRLTCKGSTIHCTAEIGMVKINGNKNNLFIGSDSFLGTVTISLFEKVIIGNKVCINDGVQILTGSHDVSDPEWKHIKREIKIDDYVWIATNAIILPGVHIGRGAVIGAGAVVSKNVLAGSIVAGNPARPVSGSRTEKLSYNPCEFLAANRAWLIG